MKRVRLTKAERAAIFERQGGRCISWGCMETKDLIEEHTIVFKWTGDKADALMCVKCHKEKTRSDIKKIAKVRRLQKGPKKSKRPIRSRGFRTDVKKKMDGSVVRK